MPPAAPHLWHRIARKGWHFLALTTLSLVALIAIVLFLTLRPHYQIRPGEPIEIAVVTPPDQDTAEFLFGVRIAVNQINADGGLLGHPVAVRKFWEDTYTDKDDLEKVARQTLRLAADIAKIPSVLAVIGHGSSATAVPASAVYDRSGKLFMATHATATSLTNHRLEHVFAIQPSNADNAAILAEYARRIGLRRFVIVSDSSSYGVETTDRFRSLLAQNGGTTLFRVRLGAAGKSINDHLLFMLDNELFKPADIDAFFITSASIDDTAAFIARARQLGLKVPILGAEYLVTNELEQQAGAEAMRGVIAVSLFGDNDITPEREKLAVPFRKALGYEPGLMAGIGFDAVKVLAYAVQRTGNLDTDDIADTLRIIRFERPFIGATGAVSFDSNGLITDTDTYVVRHDGTAFRTVATFHKPLNLSPADDVASPKGERRQLK